MVLGGHRRQHVVDLVGLRRVDRPVVDRRKARDVGGRVVRDDPAAPRVLEDLPQRGVDVADRAGGELRFQRTVETLDVLKLQLPHAELPELGDDVAVDGPLVMRPRAFGAEPLDLQPLLAHLGHRQLGRCLRRSAGVDLGHERRQQLLGLPLAGRLHRPVPVALRRAVPCAQLPRALRPLPRVAPHRSAPPVPSTVSPSSS